MIIGQRWWGIQIWGLVSEKVLILSRPFRPAPECAVLGPRLNTLKAEMNESHQPALLLLLQPLRATGATASTATTTTSTSTDNSTATSTFGTDEDTTASVIVARVATKVATATVASISSEDTMASATVSMLTYAMLRTWLALTLIQ